MLSGIKKAVRTVTKRSPPKLLTVKEAWRLTPNMIRVTFAGKELVDFPEGREGGNCKLMLPEPNETREHFQERLINGPSPVRRTYTVRHFNSDTKELDIDFVAHGDNGPASRWANQATPGDFLGFAGPSTPKVTHFNADWYIVAADPSAIPVAAVTLEAMPRDAKGVAVFEITSSEDRQDIQAPKGVEMYWFVNPDSHQPSEAAEKLLRDLGWPKGRVQTCIAGESGIIKKLRSLLAEHNNLQREDIYISGYWKVGHIEDEYQKVKRSENT